jgi:hypothetical protein
MPTKSPAQRLIDLFGGVSAMSESTGLDKATISRFTSTGNRGCHGEVPVQHFPVIMEAARKGGFPAQARVMLDAKCPTCGAQVRGK